MTNRGEGGSQKANIGLMLFMDSPIPIWGILIPINYYWNQKQIIGITENQSIPNYT